MKTGIEFAHSREKRLMSLGFAAMMAGPAIGVTILSKLIHLEHPHIFRQGRIGQYEREFMMYKALTIEPGQDEPISRLAECMRHLGLDELMQFRNIIAGDMNFIGHRALIGCEYDEFMVNLSTTQQMIYRKTVVPTLPGNVSTHGNRYHAGEIDDRNRHEERFEDDCRDVVDGSVIYDVALIKDYFRRVIGNSI